jgi:RHS repeat-associated protein
MGNHLGSTSLVYKTDTGLVIKKLYKPWGETRYTSTTMPTRFQFTGQYREVSLGGAAGLYYFVARWYDHYLNRWIQPDNIIPEATQGVQAWDRYAYTNNNPTTYTDPSGHCFWDLCIIEGSSLLPVVLLVAATAATAAVTEFVANGGPEAVAESAVEIVELATEEVNNQVEKLKDLYDNLDLQGENVSFSSDKAGGAKSSAQHLSMLLGHDVAGFGSHPGMPDPEGRDRKTNAVGFRESLRKILDNMRKGENLQQYLERQGWTSDQIAKYMESITEYMEYRLPVDVEYYGVTEDLQQELWNLLEQMGAL